MRGLMLRAGMLAACVGAVLALAGGALADSATTVCASGCPYTSIQAAINAAIPGATISIGPGSYAENVTVNTSVTLRGSGNATVIYPAVSAPNPCASSSLCGGMASNIILVQANNVTISNLRLEGDNPSLTSGVVVGGADIDARNGIITDHSAGTWNNLTVSHVTISDIYLRGIYASSGGSFTFLQNRVDNVQADGSSIAIFNFGGSGLIAGNRVSHANDAISSNWSTGTQYSDNVVTHSTSGIHTDNNGGSGGVADTIEGNTVRSCTTDGYGIWVFAPYVSATIESNQVEGCAVGLAAFGSQVAGQGPLFKANDVQGDNATTTDPTGTYGAYVSTDLLGYGFANVNVTFVGNSFQNFGTGLLTTQTRAFFGGLPTGQATTTATGNSIHDNKVGANGEAGTIFNAQNNWWGCAAGPNKNRCDTAIGTVQYAPWLTKQPNDVDHLATHDESTNDTSSNHGYRRGPTDALSMSGMS